MKFDVILANPPYDNGLHEKFSIKYFDICNGEICWVSPLSFLLGKRQNKKLTTYLDKYATDIEQINGNEYFDAAIGGTIGIIYVDMDINNQGVTFNGKEYDKSEEITQFSNDDLLMKFKNIVEKLSNADNVDNHVYASKSAKNVPYTAKLYKGYVSRIDLFAGSGSIGNKGESFYSLFSKNRNVEDNISTYDNFAKLKDKFKLYIPFKSENEGIAFYNYCKTYFCRCSLFFKKTNLHLDRGEMKSIPWFDFSDSIFEGMPEEIDIALFKKYNINQDIINHILEVLPNYYELDLDKYKG